MDKARFTTDCPGGLVKVSVEPGKEDWAFVPDELSAADAEPPTELWPLLAEARENLARLDGAGLYLPGHELLLRPLQQREALASSSLEGTYATPRQLLLYGLEPREPESDRDPANDWREVYNYGRALAYGQQAIKDGQPISLHLMRVLHEILLDHVRGQDKKPGEFRDRQVYIGSTRRFIPPPTVSMAPCLEALERFISREQGDPLLRAFVSHYQFETIHPFLDGNGRIGRVLLSLMVFKWCRLQQPWLYLSPHFEQHKNEYIDRLFNVSAQGQMAEWIRFCLEATIRQTRDATERIDHLVKLKAEYLERLTQGSVRLFSLIECLFETPIITITQAQQKHGVTYPTAKSDIDKLVTAGILEEVEDYYPKAFVAPEIMKIAYDHA